VSLLLPCRGRRSEGREVHQPARRILLQHVNNTGAIRATPQPSERIEQGQIRFSRPILLDALPVADPDGLLGSHLRHKGVDQRGLAKPGLPRNEPELALALLGHAPPLLELRQLHCPRHDQTRRTQGR